MKLPTTVAASYLGLVDGRSDASILTKLAALTLLPENSRALFRLECAAQLVTRRLPSQIGDRDLSHKELSAWLAGSPFASFDDPLNNMFTAEVPFFGGSYVVFPGPVEEALYVLRCLARGLFQQNDVPDPGLWRTRADFLLAVLRLSDAVSRRAGLERGVEPMTRIEAFVPPAARLRELESAASFSTAELDDLLGDLGGAAILSEITQSPDHSGVRDEEYGNGVFFARPLVQVDGGPLVVLPHALITAATHATLSALIEAGYRDAAASAFRDSVVAGVREDLRRLGMRRVQVDVPPVSAGDPFFDAVFSLDRDGLAYVLVVVDDLAEYERGTLFGPWPVPDLSERIEARIDEVEEHLYRIDRPPNAVLHVVALQSVSRAYIAGFRDRTAHLKGEFLVLGADDIEAISLLESNDPLVLWKYAVASRRVRCETHVLAFSKLDEFDFYRSHDHSYYVTDDGRPTTLTISPEGGAALKAEIQRRYDFHGAPAVARGATAEVVLLHGERTIPIYARVGAEEPDFLVEGWPIPLWATRKRQLDRDYRVLQLQLLDLVTYWLWQLTEPLRELVVLQRLADRLDKLIVEVDMSESGAWLGRRAEAEVDQPAFLVGLEDERLLVTFNASFARSIESATNAGERELVRALAMAVAELARADDVGEEAIDRAVDAAAPLGPKKKIVVHDRSADPRLDDDALPRPRRVQQADEALLLDDLGDHLHAFGREPGALDRESANVVLNECVAYFYRRLETLVASLDPEGLLESLVVANEALVSHQAHREISVPTEVACFSSAPATVERLVSEIPKAAEAAIATRFLIEYVTAKPPTGLRPFSLRVLDELVALASQIFNLGHASDSVKYQVGDVQASILPSRRLGFNRDTPFAKGRTEFLNRHARSEVARRTRRFDRLWDDNRGAELPEELDEVDDAVRAEFGLALTEIIDFHAAVLGLGYETDAEPKVRPFDDFLVDLSNELGWYEYKTRLAIGLHTLASRNDFSKPEGFTYKAVVPWRFNRPLSYIRRPLLLRRTGNTAEVIWGTRHLYEASRYFFDLCTGGRLDAKTPEMKRVLSRWRLQDARSFNDQVAALFSGEDARVSVRRTDFGRLKIERSPGELITDIDVLVIEPSRKRVRVIETKALAPARTPRELESERAATFSVSGSKPSEVQKLLEAAAWVEAHLADVLAHEGVETKSYRSWRVRPLMVVEAELMTPFVEELPVQVMTVEELREQRSASA